jgi:hypothetical protein
VLDSNAPAVNADAHGHAGRMTPKRNDAARAAKPTASSASTGAEPHSSGNGRPGVSTDNQRVNAPDRLCRAPEPAPPTPHRVRRHPQAVTDTNLILERPRRDHRADHLDRVPPAHQAHVRQKTHASTRRPRTPPPRAETLPVTQHPMAGEPPPGQRTPPHNQGHVNRPAARSNSTASASLLTIST